MLITWDEPKRLANLAKHGLDFGLINEAFFARAIIRVAKAGRWKAFGQVQGRMVSVVFKPLGIEALSVISMRPASQKERRLL